MAVRNLFRDSALSRGNAWAANASLGTSDTVCACSHPVSSEKKGRSFRRAPRTSPAALLGSDFIAAAARHATSLAAGRAFGAARRSSGCLTLFHHRAFVAGAARRRAAAQLPVGHFPVFGHGALAVIAAATVLAAARLPIRHFPVFHHRTFVTGLHVS